MWRDPLADPIQGNALVHHQRPRRRRRRHRAAAVHRAGDGRGAAQADDEAGELRDQHALARRSSRRQRGVSRAVARRADRRTPRDARATSSRRPTRVRPKTLSDMLATAERYERWAATGKDDEGKPLEERRRTRAGEIAALDRAIAAGAAGHPARRRRTSPSPTSWCCTAAIARSRSAGSDGQHARRHRRRAAEGAHRGVRRSRRVSRFRSCSGRITRSGRRRSTRWTRCRSTRCFPVMDRCCAIAPTCGRCAGCCRRWSIA